MPTSPFPALLLRRGSERVLVVADLHIGWEVALVERGIHVPSQTPRMLERMTRLIEDHRPTRIIFLGDVKHTVATAEWREWQDVPDFFEALLKMVGEIEVIPGNHDGNLEPLLPGAVRTLPSTGVVLWGEVGLFHGHTWPAPELLGCPNLVIGHSHPVVAFRDPLGFRVTRQVWVMMGCDGAGLARSVLRHLKVRFGRDPAGALRDQFHVRARASRLFIMPSFNEFLGGQSMNRAAIERGGGPRMFITPVLRSRGVDVENAELHLLDGTFLGSIGQLRALA